MRKKYLNPKKWLFKQFYRFFNAFIKNRENNIEKKLKSLFNHSDLGKLSIKGENKIPEKKGGIILDNKKKLTTLQRNAFCFLFLLFFCYY